MASDSFIFVRHGQTQANVAAYIAADDTRLTEVGVEQARTTANEIRDYGVTLIACSPVLRAQQTAETIAGVLGIDIEHIQIIDELRERGLGVLEGKPRQYDGTWYFIDETSEGIEPRQALFERMKACLEKIEQLGKDDKVLVVGHAISGFYLVQAAIKKSSLEEFDSPSVISNADFVELPFID